MEKIHYEHTPREELYRRINRFQKLLQDKEINGAIITQNADLFYFSGTIQPCLLFIPSQGEPVLAAKGNIDRIKTESALHHIIPVKGSKQIETVLADFNYKLTSKIGLELDVLPVNNYAKFCKDFPDAHFVDVSDQIRRVRMVKSDYEIIQIKKACEIQSLVMDEARKNLKEGMTELELDGILISLVRRLGHQGLYRMRAYNQEMMYSHVLAGTSGTYKSFMDSPLGARGTTPAYAQGSGFNIIKRNMPVIIDYGVGINGYQTDMTRTFVIGVLPSELEKAYYFSREVRDFVESHIKPGISCPDVYHKVIEMVKQRGYQDHFMGYKGSQVKFIGHGIGLELDEYPIITSGFHEAFQENMVFAVEPKLIFPDLGPVGIEDDFVVRTGGLERLTTYNDDIITVKN